MKQTETHKSGKQAHQKKAKERQNFKYTEG